MKFFTSYGFMLLALALIIQPGCAQQSSESFAPEKRPGLVVGIVVDQMRYDYLTQYWGQLGDHGFKRMVNGGYNFTNNHYNYFPTYTGPGHAAVYSGATPSVNGVVGNSWYSRELDREVYVVEDDSVEGLGGEGEIGKRSPANLVSTTFTDELKKVSRASKVISVSLKDRGAVLPAGHNGDMAFWYDDVTGNLISSTWYMNELPEWVQQFNSEGAAREYSRTIWELLLDSGQYTNSNNDNTPYEEPFPWEDEPVFPHELGKFEGETYWTVKSSPFGNTLVKDFAKAAINNEKLGQDDATDVLAISFSSTDYVGHQFGPNSVELEDLYIKLDRDLADLLSELDTKVGKGNYLVFLTSDHGVVDVPSELKDRGLPGGYFESGPVVDSLAYYLNNKYGKEIWIRAYTNQQIYLNRKLIKERGLSLKQIQNEAADFLLQFEGVLSTNTAHNFMNERYTDGLQAMYQRGFQYQRSGDVFIQLKPGWLGRTSRTGTSHGSPYNYDTHVPMILYGWGVPHGTSSKKTEITQLAPAISNLLQIPLPSGSDAKPLQFDD